MNIHDPTLVAAAAATALASLAFVNAPAIARDRGGQALSDQRSAPRASDKRTGSGKPHPHAQRGNKGGQERGLDRADGSAGLPGDRGRDRAARNQSP